MIFSSKLELGQSHSYESRDNQKNDEDNKEDVVYRVNHVASNTSKYIVKLNIDGTKWKETYHCHLRNDTPILRQQRDLSRVLGCTAKSLELCLTVFTSKTTQHK
ncbi:hypothetical protein AB3S75_013461 [Citrus x aurantiifolia]